jgi:hypothetical protein
MKVNYLVASVISLLFISCSSSVRITNSWKSENIPQTSYQKIMVVGMLPETERNLREEMENHLVVDLQRHGYNAISSFRELGPKAFENQTEQEVLDKIKDYGVDAVLTIGLLDKQRERYYVPGRIYYSPYIVYQRHFWGYYTTIYHRIYTPGYYINNTKYFWESNFYDMNNRNLLYSAQTESFDPASAATLSHEYGQLIVNDMAKRGILK